jgi:hypothetical protein
VTAAQRAVTAARALPAFEEVAKKRRSHVLPAKGTTSREDAAAVFKVGKNSVQQAKALLAEAPDLVQQVEACTTSLAAAYEELQARRKQAAQKVRNAERAAQFKDAISNGEMTVEEALLKVQERQQAEREEAARNAEALDGRNRYLACEKAGVEPRFVEYEGDDPLAQVNSLNLSRDLTPGQRAVVAARQWLLGGDTRDKGKGRRGKDDEVKILPHTLEKLAKQFRASKSSIQQARDLLAEAPDLAQQVERCHTSLAAAHEVKAPRRAPAGGGAGEDGQERQATENHQADGLIPRELGDTRGKRQNTSHRTKKLARVPWREIEKRIDQATAKGERAKKGARCQGGQVLPERPYRRIIVSHQRLGRRCPANGLCCSLTGLPPRRRLSACSP